MEHQNYKMTKNQYIHYSNRTWIYELHKLWEMFGKMIKIKTERTRLKGFQSHRLRNWWKNDCRMTAWWHSDNCQTTAAWLTQWLPYDCLTTDWRTEWPQVTNIIFNERWLCSKLEADKRQKKNWGLMRLPTWSQIYSP